MQKTRKPSKKVWTKLDNQSFKRGIFKGLIRECWKGEFLYSVQRSSHKSSTQSLIMLNYYIALIPIGVWVSYDKKQTNMHKCCAKCGTFEHIWGYLMHFRCTPVHIKNGDKVLSRYMLDGQVKLFWATDQTALISIVHCINAVWFLRNGRWLERFLRQPYKMNWRHKDPKNNQCRVRENTPDWIKVRTRKYKRKLRT